MGKWFNLEETNLLVIKTIKSLCSNEASADRYQIIQAIKQDNIGSQIIRKAIELYPENLPDHIAGNMVDWFSRRYTENAQSVAEATNSLDRVKEKRKNPSNGKYREVWVYKAKREFLKQSKLGTTEGQEIPYADEVSGFDSIKEGAVKIVKVNAYERSPDARERCVKRWGLCCIVCNFNFESFFGQLGEGYIHVHHLKPLAEIREEYEIVPEEDLRPVCPNCHSMLHRNKPALSIEELQNLVRRY